MGWAPCIASFRANSQTTPNLNVPTNRRFQTTGFEPQEADMKTVNALATLRRQNTNSGASATKRPALGKAQEHNVTQLNFRSLGGRNERVPFYSFIYFSSILFGGGLAHVPWCATKVHHEWSSDQPRSFIAVVPIWYDIQLAILGQLAAAAARR